MATNRPGFIMGGLIVPYAFWIIALFPFNFQAASSKPESTREVKKTTLQAQIVKNYGKIPLHFEANRGQTDPSVKFLARGAGYGFFLASTEAVMSLKKPRSSVSDKSIPLDIQAGTEKSQGNNVATLTKPCASDSGVPCEEQDANSAAIRMRLLGVNPSSQVAGMEELPGKTNYFQGNDPAQWRTDVPTYAKVKYQEVYPGIDLAYYGNQNQLEYDFIVAPGADLKAIKFGFAGMDETASIEPRIDNNGDLIVSVEGGEARWKKPIIYQEKAGQRKAIEGKFVLANGKVGFQVAVYDKNLPLVIDPVLVFSTYLGGSGYDIGHGIAVDRLGNVYVAGQTKGSINYPTKKPIQKAPSRYDAFVAKLNKSGTALIYSTYLGGSKDDSANDIAVDNQGNAYITGKTASNNFPTKNALQKDKGNDSFVTKLNASGSALVYSTYLGGQVSIDEGHGIAVDKSGNAYVTGTVYVPIFCTSDFPTTKNAFQPVFGCSRDAFVTKFNASGSALVYSTFLGGDSSEWGNDIAVDGSGNAYVTGEALEPFSVNFPIQNPFQKNHHGGISDAFVTKLNASGTALIYSTYVGGIGRDVGLGIAVDTFGNAYMTGETKSLDFPLKNALQKIHGGGGKGPSYENDDAFITKINKSGTALIYSTYLGGKDPANTASSDG